MQVYRGVVQEYSLMVNELTSGACIAMEIKATERAQERFRELCGPMDPVRSYNWKKLVLSLIRNFNGNTTYYRSYKNYLKRHIIG